MNKECRNTLYALTETMISRLKADDIEGASRALSWFEHIAKYEHEKPLNTFDSEGVIYAEALSWMLGLQNAVSRKKPHGIGTFVANSRKCLSKITKRKKNG